MEGLDVVGHGEVHAVSGQEPVVVFAVDQVLDFLLFFVDRQVEEVANAVGFFADVVALHSPSGQPEDRNTEFKPGSCLLLSS